MDRQVPAASSSLARVRAGSLTDALWLLGLGAVVAAATEIALVAQHGGPYAWLSALYPVVGLGYVAAGLLAWRRRPSSRLGFLIALAGASILLTALGAADTPVTDAIAAVTQTVVFAVITHLLLSFPTGRLHGRAERIVTVAGYVVSLVFQAPAWLYDGASPLAIADRPDLIDAGLQVQRALGAMVVSATAVLLVRHMRTAGAEQRRVLVPLTAYGIFAVLFIPVSSAVNSAFLGGDLYWLGLTQLAVVAVVPVVFVVASSHGGFERTADLAELGAWLGADEIGRPELRDALAAALGDPSIEVLFRIPGQEQLVDDHGVPAPPDDHRGTVDVQLGGRVVGAIRYDAMLLDRPEEIREAGRVVALALDRQRLAVELRASRARIAATADGERRRIARDLHDGLQSRLVLLAVQAASGERDALRDGIRSAIQELRELVDGVMPSQLTERGLPAAVEDLGDRLPIPIDLRVAGLDERLHSDIETAAYFVVSEAIVNAVKHADPETLTVSLERADDELRLEVVDDGSGLARPGRGIQGMADRVDALGGRFATESRPGGGTQVVAVIPLDRPPAAMGSVVASAPA